MSSSEHINIENIFVSQYDKREFRILSLLFKTFDYKMESVVWQIVQNSDLFENVYKKYGIEIIKESYKNACMGIDTKRMIPNKKEVETIVSVSDWANVINSFIESQVEQNVDISWFVQTIDLILSLCPNGITVGVESQYVDRIYRDSYYMHIGGEHFNKSRFCKRLVIFNDIQCDAIKNCSSDDIKILQENFIGSIVIRPTKEKSIGRCLLSPFYFRCKGNDVLYVRVSEYNISYSGIRLSVKAFPFEMQDGITTTCAEVTLLNLLDYYSNEFQDYKFATPSSLKHIIQKLNADRVTPATGISYEDISRVLCQTGFTPKFYRESYNADLIDVMQIISFYVESGIPVAIGMNETETKRKRGHSVICIGHTDISNKQITKFVHNNIPNNDEIELIAETERKKSDERPPQNLSLKKQTVICRKTPDGEIKTIHRVFSYVAIEQFIIQDDLMRPYNIMKPDIEESTLIDNATNNKWFVTCVVAPLYKRMHMDAKQARKVVDQVLLSKLGPINKGIDVESCIVVRLFLASSKNLQQHRVATINNPRIKNLYRLTPFPQFVWVAELYDIANFPNEEAFGEIILDATNAEGVALDSVIMINYNSRHLARDRDGTNISWEVDSDNPDSFSEKALYRSFDFAAYPSADKCTYKPYNHNLSKFSNKTNGLNNI